MRASVIAAGFACAFGLTAVWLYWQLDTERRQVAVLASQVADLQSKQPTTSGQWRQPVTSVPSDIRRVYASERSERSSDPQPVSEGDTSLARRTTTGATSLYHAALKVQNRRRFADIYSDIGTVLHLTPRELDQALDVLAEQATRAMDTESDALTPAGAAKAGNGSGDAQAMQQRMAQFRAAADVALAGIVGTEKLKQWHDYENSLDVRLEVRRLRADLATTATPLLEDLLEPLVASIAAVSRDDPKTDVAALPVSAPEPLGPQYVALLEKNLDAATARKQRWHGAAQAYVSTEQLAHLDRLLDEQIEAARSDLSIARAQYEEGAR
jgi:hypothetical protein